MQVHAFTINADAASFLWNLSVAANATNSTLIVADLEDDYLRLCPNVPSDLQDPLKDCKIVWTANATGSNALSSSSYGAAKSLSSTPVSSLPIPSSSSETESIQSLSSSESLTATGASLAALASTAVERTTTVFVTAVPTGVVDALSEEDDEEEEEDIEDVSKIFTSSFTY